MFSGMEHNRIQKLLLSEYFDFSDKLLVESPFAETTRDGRGLREVALGLTPSRLVIAADILKNNSDFMCPPDLDPSIESFELVSVYPLEFVTLSVFRRRRRRTLKARLIDGRAKYYELGGMECKNMFWTLWCDHIRSLLAKKENGSSLSETTAASSSSASTLYLLSSGVEFNKNNKFHGSRSQCRVWTHYGAGDGQSPSWTRKDVYLGPSYAELAHGYYTPIPVRFAGVSLEELNYILQDATPKNLEFKKTCSSWPCNQNFKSREKNKFGRGGGLCDVLFTRESKRFFEDNSRTSACSSPIFNHGERATVSETLALRKNVGRRQQKRKFGSPRKQGLALAPKISRFGFGVHEKCRSGLHLQPWRGDKDHFQRSRSNYTEDPHKLIDGGVNIWEEQTKTNGRARKKLKHPRRYAFASAAHFLHALGPWSVQPGERESVQRHRASSAVNIRRQPMEPELRLPVSKRQLTTSISMTSLEPGKSETVAASPRGKVILFWTPEYWYRPRAATTAYRELRRHLSLLRDFRIKKERSSRKKFFCRQKCNIQGDSKDSSSIAGERSSCMLGKIFSSKDTKRRSRNQVPEDGKSHLRHLLRMDLRITVWDLDSTTIARQLTLIDRDLFLRIPCLEIEILIFQRSSRNAPNLGAWIAFSHRISCLTASEILTTKQLDMRTRIIARFINAADKCYAVGNFHSCRSIIAGLQSPAIYRLKSTWSHLRVHHSTRYATMENLCKIYKDTTSRSYRRAWNRCEKRPPALPYVGHFLSKILSGDRKLFSPAKTLSWDNRPCNLPSTYSGYSRDKVSCATTKKDDNKISYIKSLGKIIVDDNINGKINDIVKTETPVERRQSIGRRILSAAVMRIGYPKTHLQLLKQNDENIVESARQRVLARKFYTRWRRFVLTRRILTETETKMKSMDEKCRRVLEITTWMTDCQRQAQAYNFTGHSLAWEFLLKARYREDRENFFISLKLEPPCR